MGRLWSPRWLLLHVAALVLVVGFLALGWWQIGRAVAGNTLSFAYAFEWPVFAGFVVFVWVRQVRDELRSSRTPEEPDTAGAPGNVEPVNPAIAAAMAARARLRVGAGAGTDGPADDTDLTAYNRYLAWLNENPDARPGDYRG